MKYGEMTFQQIKDAARKGWLVIQPVGCTEQQGFHLPVDWDTWFAEKVCVGASELAQHIHKVHSLVLPALPSDLLRNTGISAADTWTYPETFMKRLFSRR